LVYQDNMTERLTEEQIRDLADQVRTERERPQAVLDVAIRQGIGDRDQIEDARYDANALKHFERGLRVALGEEFPYVDTLSGLRQSFRVKNT